MDSNYNSWPSGKVVMFNIISVKITIAIIFLKSSLKGGFVQTLRTPLPTPLNITGVYREGEVCGKIS